MISIQPSSASAPEGLTFADGFKAQESSLSELAWLILAYQWSPIIWQGGRRLQERFVESHFLALDFDAPEYPLIDALRGFQGLAHLIGTTRSHRKDKGGVVCDRYRVVIPWTEPIKDLAVYRHNVCLALRMYEHADHSCKDGARLYFPCKTIVHVDADGDTWDVEPLPVGRKTQVNARSVPQRHFSPFAVNCLENVMPLHTRNNACFRLGCEFSRLGFGIDDAIARICASPTYAGIKMATQPALFAEIEKCVRHGFKAEAAK